MTDIRAIAQGYIDAGWQVVPLVKGEKRASTSWQKKTYTAADFKLTDGIAGKCGEPSGWRVDLDCDGPEAIDAAKLIVPHTGLIHGRPGKPSSHYWFICEGIRTYQFTDVKDSAQKTKMLVEIRSTGGYTALPPSTHPSGDVLSWESERDPLTLAADDLYETACDVALTAFVLRHWGELDHASMGHLAGFWLQGGMDPARVLRLFKTVGALAPGQHLNEITAFAQTTIAKFAADERITGGPKLAESIGPVAVAKMRGWLKFTDTDALDEMNERHFLVTMGKDTVIGREDIPGGVIFQQPRALYLEYANREVVVGEDKHGNPKLKPLFDAWLKSKTRRDYRKVIFSPPPAQADASDYNLWQGYAVEPKPGDCSLFLTHLRDVICSGNEEHYQYLLNLLALTVQEPGTPSEVATILRGKPGTGKGIFVRAIGDLFGRRHYTQLDKVEQLTGNFNAALSGKVIVFADEALWAGDKRGLGALKRLITEPTLHIVRKGIDGTDEDNHVHLFLATNEDWSWPAMWGERRGFMPTVSATHMQDTAYFGRVATELRNGGLEALLQVLLDQPVDRALLRTVPKTEELRRQQIESLKPHQAWWHECLEEGRIGQLGWPGDTWIATAGVYAAYKTWSDELRHKVLNHNAFSRKLNTFLFQGKTENRNQAKCGLLRTLADARNVFDKEMGSTTTWDEPESRGDLL